VFGYVDERRGTPVYNVLLVGLFTYIASLCLNYERAAELINFGAFIAFMGVNAAVIRQFYFLRSKAERRMVPDVLLPGAGFLFCLAIWLSLPTQAKLLGCFWFSLGLIWSAIQTRGFRVPPLMVSFEEV
jgi:putrescine importer